MTNGREFGQRSTYEIRVQGNLGQEWSAWFDGFTITPLDNGDTILVGQVADQPALHGLLAKIRDLGLTLVRVERITCKKETKMNTQKDKESKNKIMTIFWGMVFLLAGGGLLVGNSFGIEVIGPVILFLFALCFISIAIRSKKTWWAIIPGGIFASLGVAAVMDILIPHSEVNGLAFMFLLALSFIVFAIRSKKNWWAIIPGGIFASIDLVVVLVFLVPHKDYPALPNTLHWGVYTWVLFLGFAATFGVLWLLRKTQPTDWAKYPAAGLLVIAVMALILGSRFQEIWTVSVLVAIGAMLILGLLTRVHLPSRQQPPHIKA